MLVSDRNPIQGGLRQTDLIRLDMVLKHSHRNLVIHYLSIYSLGFAPHWFYSRVNSFTYALAPPPPPELWYSLPAQLIFPNNPTHIPESHMIHLNPMPILKLITGVGGWDIKLARVEPEGGITVWPSPPELQAWEMSGDRTIQVMIPK